MVNSAVRDKTWFKKSVAVDVGGGHSKGVDLHMEGGQNKASLCGPYSSDKLVPATSSNWEWGRGGEVIWSLYATADERNRQQPEMKPGRCATPTRRTGNFKSVRPAISHMEVVNQCRSAAVHQSNPNTS